MPLIMPIKDLRNTTEISNIAHSELGVVFRIHKGKLTYRKVSIYKGLPKI